MKGQGSVRNPSSQLETQLGCLFYTLTEWRDECLLTSLKILLFFVVPKLCEIAESSRRVEWSELKWKTGSPLEIKGCSCESGCQARAAGERSTPKSEHLTANGHSLHTLQRKTLVLQEL